MKTTRKIFCCGCQTDVDARLVDGRTAYPHRRDLAKSKAVEDHMSPLERLMAKAKGIEA